MNLNFPLILLLSTAVTGLVCLCSRAFSALNWDLKATAGGRFFGAVAELSRSFFPVLALVLVLRSFLFEPFQIPSSSMYPTLEVGDFVLVNKYAYGLRFPVWRKELLPMGRPKRGDVAVFFPPHDDRYFIKRIIGLPGDLLEYKNKRLYINGQAVPLAQLDSRPPYARVWRERFADDHEHLIQDYEVYPVDDFSVRVRPGHYFLMGDNRDNSRDSRVWGQVPEANFVGRAIMVWMHWKEFFSVPSFSRNGFID